MVNVCQCADGVSCISFNHLIHMFYPTYPVVVEGAVAAPGTATPTPFLCRVGRENCERGTERDRGREGERDRETEEHRDTGTSAG